MREIYQQSLRSWRFECLDFRDFLIIGQNLEFSVSKSVDQFYDVKDICLLLSSLLVPHAPHLV